MQINEGGKRRMMKAYQIWEIDRLRDEVAKASLRMRKKAPLASLDRKAPSACMVQVLAPAGYHQVQRIADAFGVDFDEQFSNEYEWDRFRQELSELKAKVELELRGRLELPEGTFFCLGYDPEGNFGLILRSENTAWSMEGTG
jgi:hypothetical protein